MLLAMVHFDQDRGKVKSFQADFILEFSVLFMRIQSTSGSPNC